MLTLFTIAGVITGWIFIEIIAAIVNRPMPIAFDIGMAFVGGLIGYNLYI